MNKVIALDVIRPFLGYITFSSLALILSYSVYLIYDENTIIMLCKEDGAFEYMGGLFFFIAGITFFRAYRTKSNLFFLLLSIVFFMGAGEEISWGQRILKFYTPDYIKAINVQGEFNLHNIEVFNVHYFSQDKKKGFEKLLTISFLFKLFWLGYCFLLPICTNYIRSVSSFTQKIKLPVPPLVFGIFFLINWLVFRISLSYLLPIGHPEQYYGAIGEIRECLAAFLFMLLSIYFFRREQA